MAGDRCPQWLPLLPSQQTMHFMSKAAVAVYEAAVDNQREPG
jgi:hypothetical protein